MSNLRGLSQQSTQLLLAKLVTNPRLVREAINKTDEFMGWLNIGEKQRHELVGFIKTHGERFLASSQLLAKKRLDDIIDAMQVGRKIFVYELIQNYFENYIEKTGLDEYVSKNPIVESIHFCKYIISNENICDRERIVLEYDLTRNLVLHELMIDGESYGELIQEPEAVSSAPVCQIKALIHPSIRIKKFPAGTSLMIKAIANNSSDDRLLISSEEEILIFHKNWLKSGVVTLKVSPDTVEFIKTLMSTDSLGHAYHLLHEVSGVDIEILKQVVRRFIECGLCAIQYGRRSDV
tara:strand:- start:191 stop:1069 length:879 start_codon:yes stop_codon:yes gene_type:complete